MRPNVLIALGLLTVSTNAEAEQPARPPECSASSVPRAGDIIPANAPALALSLFAPGGLNVSLRSSVLSGSAGVLTSGPDDASSLTLLRLGSELVPHTSYRLDYEVGCSQYGESVLGFPRVFQTLFQTGPRSALPTVIGSLSEYDLASDRTFTNLILDPAPELAAYLPLTSIALRASGKEWARIEYGRTRIAPAADNFVCAQAGRDKCISLSVSRRQLSVPGGGAVGAWELCSTDVDAIVPMELELVAHVAGASADPPPLKRTLQIRCMVESVPPTDKTPLKPDAGPQVGTGDSVGLFSCSAAPATTGSLVGLFVAAALLLRRR